MAENMDAVIKTKGLTKVYGRKGVKALDDLNLEVPKNAVFGFLGPNAAGKTTTINLLLGHLVPTAGTAWILGEEIGSLNIKRRIGFLPENPYFYNYLTAVEFLDLFATLFGLSGTNKNKKIEKLLDTVGLYDRRNELIRKFSRGMLQRIGIAQAVINDPDLVILDEPITGLDPVGRKEVRDIIHKIKGEKKSIFFSSHVLHDVELICDHIGILCKGKLIRTGRLEDFLKVKEVEVSCEDLDVAALPSLQTKSSKVSMEGNKLIMKVENDEIVPEIINIMQSHHGKHISAIPKRESLEDIFIEEIKKGGGYEEHHRHRGEYI